MRQILIENTRLVVATFYKFSDFPDFRTVRQPLLEKCNTLKVKGTILLAEEGINGTIAGDGDAVSSVMDYLKDLMGLEHIEFKLSTVDEKPFYRMKVKIREEIVTMGLPGINPGENTGKHVDAAEWNELVKDPEVLVIDTRNHFEYEVGTFPGAISPETTAFTDFPDYVSKNLNEGKNRKIAMFCTGGIRCEKATSYMLQQGFTEVFQLNGGILKYLEAVSPRENLWQGECFVFDQRVSVNEQLKKGGYELCYGCRMPVSPEDRKSDQYEEGVSCPRCIDHLTDEKKQNLRERHKQVSLAKARNQHHIGVPLNKN